MVPTQQRSLIDCGPVTSYKVVLEPKYFTETREVPSTEYQNETRYRTRTVPRTVPVETQDYRTITTLVPRSETKTIEYTVLVPQTSEKSVDVVETVQFGMTFLSSTQSEFQRLSKCQRNTGACSQLVDQEFTYTVQVPQSQTETRIHTVTNAVPVTRTRTIQVLQPVTRTQTVTKDYGHWETYVEEVAVPSAASVVHRLVPTQRHRLPTILLAIAVQVAEQDTDAACGASSWMWFYPSRRLRCFSV